MEEDSLREVETIATLLMNNTNKEEIKRELQNYIKTLATITKTLESTSKRIKTNIKENRYIVLLKQFEALKKLFEGMKGLTEKNIRLLKALMSVMDVEE